MTLPRPTTRRLLILTAAVALTIAVIGVPSFHHVSSPGFRMIEVDGGRLFIWRVTWSSVGGEWYVNLHIERFRPGAQVAWTSNGVPL